MARLRVEKVGEEEQVAPALAILRSSTLQSSSTTFRDDYSTTRPSRRRDREARLTVSALRRTTTRNVPRSLLFRSSLLLSLSIDARTRSQCGRAERSCACPEPRAPGGRGPCAPPLALSLARTTTALAARVRKRHCTMRDRTRGGEGHARWSTSRSGLSHGLLEAADEEGGVSASPFRAQRRGTKYRAIDWAGFNPVDTSRRVSGARQRTREARREVGEGPAALEGADGDDGRESSPFGHVLVQLKL